MPDFGDHTRSQDWKVFLCHQRHINSVLCGYGPWLRKTFPSRIWPRLLEQPTCGEGKNVEKNKVESAGNLLKMPLRALFCDLERVEPCRMSFILCVCVCVFNAFVWRKEGNDWPCLHTHTHTHIVKKTPWHIGVVNFLCLVQDLFLSTQISGFPSSPRQEHPITSYGTGKAFYTCGRCSAHQFRLADVPRRSP